MNPGSQNNQGAAIGGWLCFFLGSAIMYWSVWAFLIYVPLFFVSFVLSITALAQRRIVLGIILLLATLIAPPLTWLYLSTTRLKQFADAHPVPGLEPQNASRNIVAPGQPPAAPSQAPATSPQAGQAPREAPTSQPTNPAGPPPSSHVTQGIAGALSQPIADKHAWELAIAHTSPLPGTLYRGLAPVFSKDGKMVTYGQTAGDTVSLVCVDLETHEIVARWTPNEEPSKLGWSADGKFLAYISHAGIGGRPGVHIVDWQTKKDVALPLEKYFDKTNGRLVWSSSNAIALISGNAAGFSVQTLDLDSLVVEDEKTYNGETAQARALWKSLALSDADHKYSKILPDSGEDRAKNGPFLVIAEKDDPYAGVGKTFFYDDMIRRRNLGTYSHVLLYRFFRPDVFVTADLRHILVADENTLVHHVLGTRAAPQIVFEADYSRGDFFPTHELKDPEIFFRRKVPFWGLVYEPLTNPLNGKVVGPNRDALKARVRLAKWDGDKVIFSVAQELALVQAGDVVADVACEQWADNGNHRMVTDDKKWAVLRPSGLSPLDLKTAAQSDLPIASSPSSVKPSDEPSAPGTPENFLKRLLSSESARNIDAILDFYADRVDFHDDGIVEKAFIRKDQVEYFSRWPVGTFEQSGDFTIDSSRPGSIQVTWPMKFRVENTKGDWIEGDVTRSLVIDTTAEPWKITAEKGQVTRREKGVATQPGVDTSQPPKPKNTSAGRWRGNTRSTIMWGADKGKVSSGTLDFQIDASEQSIRFPNGRTCTLKKEGDLLVWSFGKSSRGTLKIHADGRTGTYSFRATEERNGELALVASGVLRKQ